MIVANLDDIDICDEVLYIEPKVTAEPKRGENNIEKLSGDTV